MKTLYESILDDEDEIMDRMDKMQFINDYLKDNYNIKHYTIEPNGTVNVNGNVSVKNNKITELTNGFKFGLINGYFSCDNCPNLKSLKGAPEKLKFWFSCTKCHSLKDLKGAPDIVGTLFDCSNCNNLESLEGSPKKVGNGFCCSNCKKLKSIKGITKDISGFISSNYEQFSKADQIYIKNHNKSI